MLKNALANNKKKKNFFKQQFASFLWLNNTDKFSIMVF